jgi:hypothetical protein
LESRYCNPEKTTRGNTEPETHKKEDFASAALYKKKMVIHRTALRREQCGVPPKCLII